MTSSADSDFEQRVAAMMAEIGPIIERHTAGTSIEATIIVTKVTHETQEFSFLISSSIEDNDEMMDLLDDVFDEIEEAKVTGEMPVPEPVKRTLQ